MRFSLETNSWPFTKLYKKFLIIHFFDSPRQFGNTRRDQGRINNSEDTMKRALPKGMFRPNPTQTINAVDVRQRR